MYKKLRIVDVSLGGIGAAASQGRTGGARQSYNTCSVCYEVIELYIAYVVHGDLEFRI